MKHAFFLCLGLLLINGCGGDQTVNNKSQPDPKEKTPAGAKAPSDQDPPTAEPAEQGPPKFETPRGPQVATFGSGCFWCTEAIFDALDGVESAVSGYMGGRIDNPTYDAVCSGLTGHAEVVQVTYDPAKVSFEELLEIFWKTHDPTTLNRQGADRGTQYRSAVFYHNDQQRQLAEYYKQKLDETGAFTDPIVTEITEASKFYVAEAYHQEYFRLNPGQGYCRAVIQPKVDKFRKAFGEKLKQ